MAVIWSDLDQVFRSVGSLAVVAPVGVGLLLSACALRYMRSGCDLDAINVTCSLPRAAERQRLARPASAVMTMALAKQGTARAIRSSAVPTGPAKHTW